MTIWGAMNFYTARDLRTTPKAIWNDFREEGEVVITHNGKPMAIMFEVIDGDFEETLRAVRQAKAAIAFSSMRRKAAQAGYLSPLGRTLWARCHPGSRRRTVRRRG